MTIEIITVMTLMITTDIITTGTMETAITGNVEVIGEAAVTWLTEEGAAVTELMEEVTVMKEVGVMENSGLKRRANAE